MSAYVKNYLLGKTAALWS